MMTDRITQLLYDVQRLDQTATTGPWEATPNAKVMSRTATWPEGDARTIADYFGNEGAVTECSRDADAELISLSRTALPKLAEALRAVLELLSAVEEDPSNKLSFMYGGEPFPATVTTNEVRQAITDALEADGVV